MIGTQTGTRPRPHGPRERPDAPSPAGALAEFEAEFFVEWQVADVAMAPDPRAAEK